MSPLQYEIFNRFFLLAVFLDFYSACRHTVTVKDVVYENRMAFSKVGLYVGSVCAVVLFDCLSIF